LGGRAISFYLEDAGRLVVGSIRLFSRKHETGERCELISISRGEVSRLHLPEWCEDLYRRGAEPHQDANAKSVAADPALGLFWKVPEVHKFYHVLWIQWEDGIAYSKALERVSQEYWGWAEKEEIDVRLG
jgi:hypothetical protein